jgi:hypothetical protein
MPERRRWILGTLQGLPRCFEIRDGIGRPVGGGCSDNQPLSDGSEAPIGARDMALSHCSCPRSRIKIACIGTGMAAGDRGAPHHVLTRALPGRVL